MYYDTEIRQQAGLSSAVIYNRIKYWCNHNALNKRNIKNGVAYCYQSYFQLAQATGYSIATVKRCLRKLLRLGLIFKREKFKKTEVNNFAIIDESKAQSFRQPENKPESNPVQPKSTENKKENTESKKQSTPPQTTGEWKGLTKTEYFTRLHGIIRNAKIKKKQEYEKKQSYLL